MQHVCFDFCFKHAMSYKTHVSIYMAIYLTSYSMKFYVIIGDTIFAFPY